MRRATIWSLGLAATIGLGGCFGLGGGAVLEQRAEARIVETPADLTTGPAAQGRPGDIVMENAYVRLIVQQPEPAGESGLGPYGGNIIDADVKRRPYEQGHDALGEVIPLYNFGRTPNAERVEIIDAGTATGRAVVRATGSDHILDSIHLKAAADAILTGASSALLGDFDPDQSVPVQIETDYILEPDARGVLIVTRFINQTDQELELVVGDMFSMLGQVEPFIAAGKGVLSGRPSSGFGIPTDVLEIGYNQVEFLAWEAPGVSYLYYPWTAEVAPLQGQTACILFSGVAGCVLGAEVGLSLDAVRNALGPDQQPGRFLVVPPKGEGVATYSRFLFIGEHGVADAARGLFARFDEATVELEVRVRTGGGDPLADADVAILRQAPNGRSVPWLHARTDADGIARIPLPIGASYEVLVSATGHPAVNGDGSPARFELEIPGTATEIAPIDVTIPDNGTVEFYAWDHARTPLPARVTILGTDPSPEVLYSSSSGVSVLATSGALPVYPFRSLQVDPLPTPPGGLSALAISDPAGNALPADAVVAVVHTDVEGKGALHLEPGTYVAIGSRGPAYGVAVTRFTVTAGRTTRVLLSLPKVVDTYGYVQADLHVHALNSPDSTRPYDAAVRSAAAEGLDFFITTDHEFISDPAWLLAELGLDRWLAIAPGEELTTFDYGHFNAFPLRADPVPQRSKPVTGPGESFAAPSVNGGAVRWWDEEADANLAPGDTLAALRARASDGESNYVQVNHPHHGDFMSYFEQIGLVVDPTKGSDEAFGSTADKAALRLAANAEPWTTAWNGLETANGGYPLKYAWRVLNDAFAFWNLGLRAVLVATSDSHKTLAPPIGNPRTWVRLADPTLRPGDDGFVTAIADALAAGQAVAANALWADLEVWVSLITHDGAGNSATATVVGPLRPGAIESLNTNPTGFPSGTTGYTVRVSATVRIQAPTWAPPERVELFTNARYQANLAEDDFDQTGSVLSAVAAWGHTITGPELTAAATTAVVRVPADGGPRSVTSTGDRYDLSYTYVFTLSGTDQPIGEDLWIAARVYGTTPLYPIVFGEDEAAVPFAIVNPVYLDLQGETTGSFADRFDGPCETAGASTCPAP